MKKKNLPEKILFVNGGLMDLGGISQFMMNYYRHMDRDRFQVDFIVHGSGFGFYDAEITQLGGRIYHVPIKSQAGMRKYCECLKKIMVSHSYRIVHSHVDEMNYPVLKVAKEEGISIRISHCHTMGMGRKGGFRSFLYSYAKLMLPTVATQFWACSNGTGRRLYGNHSYDIIPNAIEISRYSFDEKKRQNIREQYGIQSEDIVIGQVGHLSFVKNQLFFEKVLLGLVNMHNSKLKWLVIGDGEDEEKLRYQVKKDGLDSKVIFTGRLDNVSDYYNAMDLYVMPSISEGFPISAVEAQANGLCCFFSHMITRDVGLSKDVYFLPLEEASWIEAIDNAIMSKKKQNEIDGRKHISQEVQEMDISYHAERLENLYEKLIMSAEEDER